MIAESKARPTEARQPTVRARHPSPFTHVSNGLHRLGHCPHGVKLVHRHVDRLECGQLGDPHRERTTEVIAAEVNRLQVGKLMLAQSGRRYHVAETPCVESRGCGRGDGPGHVVAVHQQLHD